MPPVLQPVQANVPTTAPERALQQNRVLRNTYLLLAVTLIATAIGAVVGANLDLSFLRSSPIISLFAILAIFYGWIYAIERNRESGVGFALLLGFTLCLGVLLGPLLQQVLGLKNGAQLVMLAAGGTAAVFLALSAVARTTTRDLGGLGKFLLVGAIVIMLAVVANAFFASPVLYSSLIILWQINAIVRGGETKYISATLTLYVAIYNLFSSLLQLLGIFGGD